MNVRPPAATSAMEERAANAECAFFASEPCAVDTECTTGGCLRRLKCTGGVTLESFNAHLMVFVCECDVSVGSDVVAPGACDTPSDKLAVFINKDMAFVVVPGEGTVASTWVRPSGRYAATASVDFHCTFPFREYVRVVFHMRHAAAGAGFRYGDTIVRFEGSFCRPADFYGAKDARKFTAAEIVRMFGRDPGDQNFLGMQPRIFVKNTFDDTPLQCKEEDDDARSDRDGGGVPMACATEKAIQ